MTPEAALTDDTPPSVDAAFVVEASLSLRRLGLPGIADLILVALYRQGYANIGETVLTAPGAVSEAFHYIRRLPEQARNALLETNATHNDTALLREATRHRRHRLEDLVGKLNAKQTEQGATRFIATTQDHANTCEGGEDTCTDGVLRPIAYELRAFRRQLPSPVGHLSVSDWTHLGLKGSLLARPVTDAVFVHLAQEFYRRLTIYAHQYLEPDANAAFIPAKVYHVRFNRTGTVFTSAGDDGLIKVWDSRTARLCYTMRRHFSDICDFDLCPTGTTAISCCSSNQVKVWRLGRCSWEPHGTATLPALPTFTRFLPVDPQDANGSLLFLSTTDDGRLRIWDAYRTPCLSALPETYLPGLNWGPPSSPAAAVRPIVPALEAASLHPVYTLDLHEYKTRALDMFAMPLRDAARKYVFVAMGLEAGTENVALAAPDAVATSTETRARTRVLVCRLSINNDGPLALQHDILALPVYAQSVPDVAFASQTPSLVTGTDDGQVTLWNLSKPLDSNWGFQLPIQLRLLVTEKLEQHAYRIYQHPLARQPKHNPAVSEPELFITQLTALAWCDGDQIVITGNSVSRKTAKAADHEKTVTKETEISMFDTSTGQRLLSITDKRRVKSNISFIRVHPVVSSIVILGTFRGQILLLDTRRERLMSFLETVKKSAPAPDGQLSSSSCGGKGRSLPLVCLNNNMLFNVKTHSIDEITMDESTAKIPIQKLPGSTLDLILQFLSFPNACFLDGRWCPNGQFFVASQRDGCLSIFTAVGCKSVDEVFRLRDSMTLTPVEQFLDNDFRVFQADSLNRVVCPFTGHQSHCLPTGPALDGERVPLPLQLPKPEAQLDTDGKTQLVGTAPWSYALKDAEDIVRAFNAARLDEYGNVIRAAEYASPPLHRRGLSTPEIITTMGQTEDTAERTTGGRYGTILSAVFAADDETDSSYQSSVSARPDVHCIEEEVGGVVVSSSSLEEGNHIVASVEMTSDDEPPRLRRRRRSSTAHRSVSEESNHEEEPEDYTSFWTMHEDPVRQLRAIIREHQHHPAATRDAPFPLPNTRFELIVCVNDILESPDRVLVYSQEERTLLLDLLSAAARQYRREHRASRRRQQPQHRQTRRLAATTDTNLGRPRRRRCRTDESSSLSTSVDNTSLSPQLTPISDRDGATMDPQASSMQASLGSQVFRRRARAVPEASTRSDNGVSRPFRSQHLVPFPEFVENVFQSSAPSVLFRTLGHNGNAQHLLLSQLLAVSILLSPHMPRPTTLVKRRSTSRCLVSPQLLNLLRHFPLQTVQSLVDSPFSHTAEPLLCGVCHNTGNHFVHGTISPLLLWLFPTPAESAAVSDEMSPFISSLKTLCQTLHQVLGQRGRRVSDVYHHTSSWKAHWLKQLLQPDNECEVDAEYHNTPWKHWPAWKFRYTTEDASTSARIVGPFQIEKTSQERVSKRPRRNGLRMATTVSDNDLTTTSPLWVHAGCCFSLLCSLDAESSGYMVLKPQEQSRQLEEASERHEVCTWCEQPGGSSVPCSCCGSLYHWPCSLAAWESKKTTSLWSPPDILLLGHYVCPKPSCARVLRSRHRLLSDRFFATHEGCRTRDWLLVDTRPPGDYVPQLCDVVRVFPKLLRELPVSSVQLPLFFDCPLFEALPADAVVVNLSYAFPRIGDVATLHIVALMTLLILPPHPAAGRVLQIPYVPSNKQPFVLLSEVYKGLARLTNTHEGDRRLLFIDGKFEEGIVRHVRLEKPVSLTLPSLLPCLSQFRSAFDAWDLEFSDSFSWSTAVEEAQLLDGIDCIELAWPKQRQRRRSSSSDPPYCGSDRQHSSKSASLSSRDTAAEGPEICSCWEVYLATEEHDLPPPGAGGEEALSSEDRDRWLRAVERVCTRRQPRPPQRQIALRNRVLMPNADEPALIYEVFLNTVPEPSESRLAFRDREYDNIDDDGDDDNHNTARSDNAAWISDYWAEIELPMSLHMIRRRLENNYYRCEASVLFDFFHLYRNSLRFNGPADSVSRRARSLLSEVLDEVASVDAGGGF